MITVKVQLKESSQPIVYENVINTYTKASQFPALSAESSYKLQKIGGNILDMVNN